jgi:hypothetical protein
MTDFKINSPLNLRGDTYCDEDHLRICLKQKWTAFQLTEFMTCTNHQRYEQRDRIKAWCLTAYGMPYGIIDPRTYDMDGSWFYALSRYTNYDDYIFFKNETESSLFAMQFANDIVHVSTSPT